MHIPSISAEKLNPESFELLLKEANSENEAYDSSKWLYAPPYYTEFRYILGTRGVNPLICIGINPSTAAPDKLDNTLKSVDRISQANGFDSFIMFNVCAQRATNPSDMSKTPNSYLHFENMKAFEYILKNCKSRPSVWAAWGNIIETRLYLKDYLRDMVKLGAKYNALWYSCGQISKKGHPHHPLYLKKDLPLDLFDISSYLSSL